jgi:hypothetical protein
MCKHGDTVTVNVIRPRYGNRAGVDRCIAPIVESLNAAGVQTIASCCGHGHRPGWIALADGRQVLIMASMEEAHRISHLWPDIHGVKANEKQEAEHG